MSVVIHPHAPHAHTTSRDLARNPMIIYWEMTQACALACRHCRAEAMLQKHPRELNYTESRALLQQILAFGAPLPHLILTGGDPLMRPDVYELIDEAVSLGIEVSITPAATQNLTRAVIEKLRSHKIQSLGLSLDGSDATRHEAARGVQGCFEWTMNALRVAGELEIPIQVNTLVAAETADDLSAIYDLLLTQRVMRWSLFFLISVGRGKTLEAVSPERGEEIMRWSLAVARRAPFAIKTTEAPSYRRVALETMRANGMPPEAIRRSSVYRGFGIRDGNGIVFVSNTGDIYPAGFLPVTVGNVREGDLVTTYRHAPLMRSLHDPNTFQGKCGYCEYRVICGGSRARAFTHTGDALESDPFCAYEPVRGREAYT
ncbi:MAG: TIGR04053 family radical SAM/SPASM domain-containing protein [Chloroflexi bacterium]|nr:TIGR04053 family radical SAM/SPASM domain-containing protein [Chloroflexota bacterium]